MLVRVLAAVALALASPLAAEETPRSLRPTEDELAQFQLTRPTEPIMVEPSSVFEASGLAMFAASAADFATTELGLASGFSEGNPIAGERSVRLAHHVIGPAAVYWTTEKLRRSGRTKLALTLRIAVMVAYSYAAIHNVNTVQGAAP